MSRQLFWKMCVLFAIGVVALFYFINQFTTNTEEGMSMLSQQHRQTITEWGRTAEKYYKAQDMEGLNTFINQLKERENTWMAVVSFDYENVAGDPLSLVYEGEYTFGRSVDWKIHLYFDYNPIMEVSFNDIKATFLVQLPDRMRPGAYWSVIRIAMQIIIPTILLGLLGYFLYRYIMKPLLQLQAATRHFSAGNFDSRARTLMGNRNDEFSDLANTFDDMACRIGEQIISQRQLISDLSHELRTPLTRLDIALTSELHEQSSTNIKRIKRESQHIRRLVDDTLTLAWLENEKPELQQESLDLIDLLDVLIDDANFEFPNRNIVTDLPISAVIENSSHRALGQAIENILRNALRYTPANQSVEIIVETLDDEYLLSISDQGPGVPDSLLTTIFKPFFRVDKSRERKGNSFGLGLALAKRQLETIRSTVTASNKPDSGLIMQMRIPKK